PSAKLSTPIAWFCRMTLTISSAARSSSDSTRSYARLRRRKVRKPRNGAMSFTRSTALRVPIRLANRQLSMLTLSSFDTASIRSAEPASARSSTCGRAPSPTTDCTSSDSVTARSRVPSESITVTRWSGDSTLARWLPTCPIPTMRMFTCREGEGPARAGTRAGRARAARASLGRQRDLLEPGAERLGERRLEVDAVDEVEPRVLRAAAQEAAVDQIEDDLAEVGGVGDPPLAEHLGGHRPELLGGQILDALEQLSPADVALLARLRQAAEAHHRVVEGVQHEVVGVQIGRAHV